MFTVKYEIQVRNTVLEKIKKGILPDKKNLQMVLGMLKCRKDIKGEKGNGGMIIYLMSRKLTDLCWLMLKERNIRWLLMRATCSAMSKIFMKQSKDSHYIDVLKKEDLIYYLKSVI